MTSLIGYCVHNTLTYQRGYSADEQSKFWQHIERLQPETLLFMDNLDWAKQAKRLLPKCIVVHRAYRGNDGNLYETMSPQAFFNETRSHGDGGIVVQVGNEPSGYGEKLPKLASWYAEVMKLFGDAGIPIAAPNFGVGHCDLDKLEQFAPMWEAFQKYPIHYFASHEYGTYRGMTFTDSTHKKDVTPWRVGRFKIVVDYVKQRFHYDLPVLITEFGIDSSFYPDDDKQKRGWRDAGITEIEYANQLIKAANEVYNVPNVKGLLIFSHGNTGNKDTESDWRTHDVSFLGDFQRTLEDYSAQRNKPVYPDLPLPYDTRWVKVYAQLKKGAEYVNLRAPRPVVDDVPPIGKILEGDELYTIPAVRYGEFVAVRKQGLIGWASDSFLAFVASPPTPPAPIPDDNDEEAPPLDDAAVFNTIVLQNLIRKQMSEIERKQASLAFYRSMVEAMKKEIDEDISFLESLDSSKAKLIKEALAA